MKNLFMGLVLVGMGSFVSPLISSAENAGTHGGHVVHKGGAQYEIVADQKELKVYTTTVTSDRPSQLTVKVKNKNGIWNRIHVKLKEQSPETAPYTGIVPANVLISGGVQFDIDFPKK